MLNPNRNLKNTMFSATEIKNLAINAAISDYEFKNLNKFNLKKRFKSSLNLFLSEVICIKNTSGYMKEIATSIFKKQYKLTVNSFSYIC